MTKHAFYLIVIGFLSLNACMTVSYVMDRQEDTVIGKYSNYFLEVHCLDDPIGVNPINQIRIANAINKNLTEFGLTRGDQQSDLLVKYFVKNESKQYAEGCSDYYDQIRGGLQCVERIRTYEEGTMIIDIIDQNIHEVIWHGAAIGPSYRNMNNPESKIEKIVKELLHDFESVLEIGKNSGLSAQNR